jgi:hypothetical protein
VQRVEMLRAPGRMEARAQSMVGELVWTKDGARQGLCWQRRCVSGAFELHAKGRGSIPGTTSYPTRVVRGASGRAGGWRRRSSERRQLDPWASSQQRAVNGRPNKQLEQTMKDSQQIKDFDSRCVANGWSEGCELLGRREGTGPAGLAGAGRSRKTACELGLELTACPRIDGRFRALGQEFQRWVQRSWSGGGASCAMAAEQQHRGTVLDSTDLRASRVCNDDSAVGRWSLHGRAGGSNAMASFRTVGPIAAPVKSGERSADETPQPHTACCLRTRGDEGRTKRQTARGARTGTIQSAKRQRQQQRPYVRRSPRPLCIRNPSRFGFRAYSTVQ